MTTRKEGIRPGVYDNLQSGRREEYDEHGNLVRSAGYVWVENNRTRDDFAGYEFGALPDIPKQFRGKK